PRDTPSLRHRRSRQGCRWPVGSTLIVVSSPDHRRSGPGRRARDRHGRGLRGRLVPASLPLSRTRAEMFDDLVLDAVESLEQRFAQELAGVEFAVEDVPPDLNVYDSDVLEDGPADYPSGSGGGRGQIPPPPLAFQRSRPSELLDEDPAQILVAQQRSVLGDPLLERRHQLVAPDPEPEPLVQLDRDRVVRVDA